MGWLFMFGMGEIGTDVALTVRAASLKERSGPQIAGLHPQEEVLRMPQSTSAV